jgi:hypothetical protein
VIGGVPRCAVGRGVVDSLDPAVPIDDKGRPEPLAVFWETEPGTHLQDEPPSANESNPELPVEIAAHIDAVLSEIDPSTQS